MLTTLAMNMNKKRRTRFGAWNVCTMSESGKLQMITAEMRKMYLSFLGISESRWTDNGEITTSEGELFIYSGNKEGKRQAGVGIVFSKEAKKRINDMVAHLGENNNSKVTNKSA